MVKAEPVSMEDVMEELQLHVERQYELTRFFNGMGIVYKEYTGERRGVFLQPKKKI
jgi:hypothetical protein